MAYRIEVKGEWAGKCGDWRPAISGTWNQTRMDDNTASIFATLSEAESILGELGDGEFRIVHLPEAYEIHPVVLLNELGECVPLDDPSGADYKQCEDDDPNIVAWGLYRHLPEGGLEHIEDFQNREAAEVEKARMENFESAKENA